MQSKGEGPLDPLKVGQPARPSSILVLGLGNPILGDDGVGWRVAEEVRAALAERNDAGIEIDCASLGGLSLMERVLGYSRVILIDAMETGEGTVGQVEAFPLEALPNPMLGHTSSAHDTSLLTALSAAQAMGQPIPGRIDMVAIEVRQSYDFSEELTPPIQAAVDIATRKVLASLAEPSAGQRPKGNAPLDG